MLGVEAIPEVQAGLRTELNDVGAVAVALVLPFRNLKSFRLDLLGSLPRGGNWVYGNHGAVLQSNRIGIEIQYPQVMGSEGALRFAETLQNILFAIADSRVGSGAGGRYADGE